MKLFARSGGHWLFWSGFIYLSLTALVALSPYSDYTMCVQLVWFILITLPLICNPLARWLNMKENTMFDWMKKNKLPENVVPFPAPKPKLVEPPPEPKKPAVTYYSLGMTSENRLEFKMGYSAITMNYGGVTNLIEQLEVYKKQLAVCEGIEEEENA
jgi:hypothetical protein